MAIYRYTQTNDTIFGCGSVTKCGEEAQKLGMKKILLVTDAGVKEAGAAGKVRESLEQAGMEIVEFSNITPDPKDYEVREAAELGRQEKVDSVVAVGGGSVMDAAKAIDILLTNPLPLEQYYGSWDYKGILPIICVPTTSGTGSENTIYGVVTYTGPDSAEVGQSGCKKVVLAKASLAICDPELTYTMDADLTGATGLDAFAHAAESLTCLTELQNPKADLMDMKAIEMLVKWLPIAVFEPNNQEARYNMLLASNFAGMGFTDTCCHIGHSFSQCMGAKFHVAHGISCAWALPETIRFAAKYVPEKVKMVCDAMGVKYADDITNEELGDLVADEIRAFMRKLEVKSIKDYGFTKEQTVSIWEMILNDNCYPCIPGPMPAEEVKEFCGRVYETYQ